MEKRVMAAEPLSRLSRRGRFLLVLGMLVAITAFHYLTPRDHRYHELHDVGRRLYYLPIVLGALFFGLRGGLLASGASSLAYLPHVIWQWGGSTPAMSLNQYTEIVMFNVVGAVVGAFAAAERRRGREAQDAYARLEASFERAKEADRLAAMGTLSAALAHEIRNPLGSLRGALPILTEGLGPEDPRQEFAEIAHRELRRLEELTTQVLEYARPSPPSFAEDSLNDLARRVGRLIEKQAQRDNVQVEMHLDPQLPMASMDSDRMTQTLLNLVLNGIQAMPEGGALTLRTGCESRWVWIAVEDEGSGLSEEAQQHLFEPFYSSKPSGTGLGLAVAYQWVTLHRGEIAFESRTPRGTVFTVRLPRAGVRSPQDPEAHG